MYNQGYQQQPQQGFQQPAQQQGQHPKNPNGGYIRQNQYGFMGQVTVTPELLQQIQRDGKVTVSVAQPKHHTNAQGEQWVSCRTVLKPVPQDQQGQGGFQQAPPQQMQQQQPVNQGYQQQQGFQQAPPQQLQQPAQQQPANMGGSGFDDDIPF